MLPLIGLDFQVKCFSEFWTYFSEFQFLDGLLKLTTVVLQRAVF